MYGCFSRPALPGQELTVLIWRVDDTTALFQTVDTDSAVVLDRGRVTFD